MAVEDERTVDVVLDQFDYEAPVVGGFTHKELAMCFFGSLVGTCFITIPFGSLVLGHFGLGFIISVVFAFIFTAYAARRAYTIKKGRPSYMLWVDIKRKWQNEGYYGIKLNFGFVKSTYWDTMRERK